jgi:hypothetical protein
MVKAIGIKYSEGAAEIFGRFAIASVEVGDPLEEPVVLVKGAERPELEDEVRRGELAKAMKRLEGLFPGRAIIWLCMEKPSGGAILFLLPRAIGTYGPDQVLVGHVCGNCGCPIGTARICDCAEPWNCAHGEIVYCIRCGAESGYVGPVHGGSGPELSAGEVEALRKIEAEDDSE